MADYAEMDAEELLMEELKIRKQIAELEAIASRIRGFRIKLARKEKAA